MKPVHEVGQWIVFPSDTEDAMRRTDAQVTRLSIELEKSQAPYDKRFDWQGWQSFNESWRQFKAEYDESWVMKSQGTTYNRAVEYSQKCEAWRQKAFKGGFVDQPADPTAVPVPKGGDPIGSFLTGGMVSAVLIAAMIGIAVAYRPGRR